MYSSFLHTHTHTHRSSLNLNLVTRRFRETVTLQYVFVFTKTLKFQTDRWTTGCKSKISPTTYSNTEIRYKYS